MQCNGFAGFVPTDLSAVGIEQRQTVRVQVSQTRVGGCDQKTIADAHADIARGGMHIATLKQAETHAANFFACF
jgi:hypothetical protein